jgi:hypothetical protein
VSRVKLRVHWSVTSTGCGADDIENTAASIVSCLAVFTELLPGNTLIKSMQYAEFEVLTAMVMKSSVFWDITSCSPLKVNG